MELRLLGGAREIGRSAVLVNDALLLDFGLSTDDPPRLPVGDFDPEAVVASHGHLDHVGALPALLSGAARPPIHWTPPTRDLALRLGRDTLKLHGGTYRCPFVENDLRRVSEVSETHGYGEPFEAAGHEVTLYPAGHIPGSAHVLVDDGETRLLYTGDFHVDDQRLVAGTTARPEADVVLCESTYADVEHEPRADVEERFVRRVERTIWEGGTVIVPAFAIGRTQEVLLICAAHGVPCYVDGMGTEITETLLAHPEYVRDADALRRAKGHARVVTGRNGQRERIADQPVAVVTTSGMLSGGPAMTYLPLIASNPTNAVTMTGYQVQGTPGRELLETGSAEIDGRRLTVGATVEAFDFSAHADREGLREFLSAYKSERILINHGDRCVDFASDLRADGFDASAPELGERIEI